MTFRDDPFQDKTVKDDLSNPLGNPHEDMRAKTIESITGTTTSRRKLNTKKKEFAGIPIECGSGEPKSEMQKMIWNFPLPTTLR